MKKLFYILFLIPLLSYGQDQKVVVAGDTVNVHGYSSDNQNSAIMDFDTIIVVGKNPKYVELRNGMSMGLQHKLPKGTYFYYQLKPKYWKKVYKNKEYDDLNGDVTKKKYRGRLSSITTYGEDSLMTGIYKSFKYDFKTKKNKIQGLAHYFNGIQNGIAIEYHHNGNIKSIGNLKNGKEDGIWFYFGENKEDGAVEFIYENGERKKTN